MGLILNDLKNACELEHVCDYVNNRTTSSMNYISTENGVLIGAVGALRMFCVFVQKKIQIANIYTIC